ncbi:rCG26746 [Rattus norvegicus]|uniref:RCG26746 n=1 Tax=Rattus norvegicus TaxID=10116 RepID=A6HPL3_RAT|nr:rCG26746 [Rattus norvegicus]
MSTAAINKSSVSFSPLDCAGPKLPMQRHRLLMCFLPALIILTSSYKCGNLAKKPKH